MRREYNIKKLNPRNNPYFKKLKNKKTEKTNNGKNFKVLQKFMNISTLS